MPQKTGKNNKPANDNTRVIKTPEGVEIQITAGRKLQQIRAFARDPDISDAQFRALVCIVDRLNEGKEGTDQSLWGSAYPSPETLAADMAKDERAARRIVKELRDGQRETRSKSGVRSFVPCKAVLSVENRKTADGHDDFNLIRLRTWEAFAIRNQKDVDQSGGGHLSSGGRSPVEQRAVTAPDSSHLLSSPNLLSSLHTPSPEGAESSKDVQGGRPAGAPAGDDLNAIVEKLEKDLPAHAPYDDHKPVVPERSRRGAIYGLKELLRIGWTVPEIESYLEAYREDFSNTLKRASSSFHPCGKTIASHLWHLVTQCGPDRNDDTGELLPGWKIPAHLLADPELIAEGNQPPRNDEPDQPTPANENEEESKLPPVRYGTHGGESDPDDPF
ncbi:helix-turn-helix domain-containing protein [Bradyrhizobium sp. NBAIM14]|uniref:helix-turn-helix domain-containing protein n=1 Tax=Bradyrhizobium sp. NBAIM14 TaxID=2793814 RepID=UPI001CD3BA51|nr:helix-turn-helix domain-containing protein [Bradyrhizobium sp. NBAIM14]MCA1498100.1 hypothetical protein [Bradyrhizobium sp. NBAIM14]